MKHLLAPLLIVLLPIVGAAQTSDSLFVRRSADDGLWHARYRVAGEGSVFGVSKKFGVPAAVLADFNGLSYAEKLTSGRLVKIPLTPANWYTYTPPVSSSVAALYFRVVEDMDWKDLAEQTRTSKRQLREWNPRVDEPDAGTVVAVGWISLGPPGLNDGGGNDDAAMPPPIPWPDTAVAVAGTKPAPVLTPMEQTFQDQTAGGTMVATEKGPAAFFPASGGTAKDVHYAFHNSAPRGAVVRVYNPGTGKTVYVKVLGPLPGTKQYAGAIIGISAAAKAALGVRGDTRAWCEVSYAGY